MELGDNQSMYLAHNADSSRCTTYNAADPAASLVPKQDTPEFQDKWRFGSAHSAGCNFVFCDGSVQTIGYDIDAMTHSYLGNRHDGILVGKKRD
jgi:prepilin-type processing-associated H-X9-DG protein